MVLPFFKIYTAFNFSVWLVLHKPGVDEQENKKLSKKSGP